MRQSDPGNGRSPRPRRLSDIFSNIIFGVGDTAGIVVVVVVVCCLLSTFSKCSHLFPAGYPILIKIGTCILHQKLRKLSNLECCNLIFGIISVIFTKNVLQIVATLREF